MQRHARVALSFAQWRDAARELLLAGVTPAAVDWQSEFALGQGQGELLSGAAFDAGVVAGAVAGAGDATGAGNLAGDAACFKPAPPASPPRVPKALMDMLESAACFNAPDRWAFLYQVLWRWQLGQHDVASAADVDGARLHAMVKAVRREEHDMHAYVRFREGVEADGAPRFVAWYEPVHAVLPQVARHFARRMGPVSWLIATPDAAVLWDGEHLHDVPPPDRTLAGVDDPGEALWLAYYRSIFNPARLNEGLMRSHIPSRFWHNLPEGRIVPAMISAAANGERRTGQAGAVTRRDGAFAIPVSAERAQPRRDAPDELAQCRRCELWRNATQAVPGTGPTGVAGLPGVAGAGGITGADGVDGAAAPAAVLPSQPEQQRRQQPVRLMLVGEQPGDQEDLAGLPFVGPAGALLDQALAQAGVARDSVYLTNAVKHFKWEPRGKRRLHKTPAQREIAACRIWLERELEQVGPEVVVALGGTALKSVTGDAGAALTPALGVPQRVDGRWVVAVYHPAYVLRAPDPETRRAAYQVMVDGLRLANELAQQRD